MNSYRDTPDLLLGTSGFTYKHWKGIFYPLELPQKRWFEFFCEKFNTVELNASFYRIPTLKTVEGWNQRSPDDFYFSVKMSRLITHTKKLRNCTDELQWFFSNFRPLYSKIKAILVQLPPAMKFNPGLIKEFSHLLPSGFKFAFEFRNTSWYRDETYDMLSEANHIFCIHDMASIPTEKIVTTNAVYIRFHGFDSTYGGDYPEQHLNEWAEWIASQVQNNRSVYGYFNNDIGGYAVKNCLSLRRLVQELLKK